MRIISGYLGGRMISAPDGLRTRPTHDRVREAVFSMIGPYFNGGNALDLFAGSGAMGFEAISRGCDHCVFCDHNRNAIRTISDNVGTLNVAEKSSIFFMDWKKCLKTQNKTFDYVFLDPPYDSNLLPDVLNMISSLGLLHQGSIIVSEMKKGEKLHYSDEQYELCTLKQYGIAQIIILSMRG